MSKRASMLAEDAASYGHDEPRGNVADDLSRVSQMADVLTEAQARVLAAERELEDAEAELRRVEQEDFPTLMQELGLTEVALQDGRKIVVTDDIECGITEANKPRAFKWLRDHKYDGIIKTELALEFARGEQDKMERIVKLLTDAGWSPEVKDSVHWQTLKSFVKERRAAAEEGKTPPDDLFGVHPVTRALVAAKGKKATKLKRTYHRKKGE